jgi:hypothetical protein
MTVNKHDRKEGRSTNIGFAKARDSVVVSTFVFLSIICVYSGERRPPIPVLRRPVGFVVF